MTPDGWPVVTLLTRRGCCLCDGLKVRLQDILPADRLKLVDVDADHELSSRFGLLVPLLVVGADPRHGTVLPRVSPRLQGDGLRRWLAKQLKAWNGQHGTQWC